MIQALEIADNHASSDLVLPCSCSRRGKLHLVGMRVNVLGQLAVRVLELLARRGARSDAVHGDGNAQDEGGVAEVALRGPFGGHVTLGAAGRGCCPGLFEHGDGAARKEVQGDAAARGELHEGLG